MEDHGLDYTAGSAQKPERLMIVHNAWAKQDAQVRCYEKQQQQKKKRRSECDASYPNLAINPFCL